MPDDCSIRTIHPESHQKSGGASRSALLLAAFLIVAVLAGTALPLGAQTLAPASGAARDKNAGELKLVVILSRHGVRPPTWTNERLNAWSALPWPVWSAPPGYLTAHGFELIKRFAGYDRAVLAQAGLLTASGCEQAPLIYIWTDRDERTKESGRAFAEGMFPGCPPATHGLGGRDPLFHPVNAAHTSVGVAPARPADGAAQHPSGLQNELMQEMQSILLGCQPQGTCVPARTPENELAGESATGEEHRADRALGLASSFAEDFLLEYAEGMPAPQVGWGHVDEAQIRRLMTLHQDDYLLTNRDPAHARREASNMLFHIVRTLQQAEEQKSIADAVGPVGSRVVVLMGHDSNIAGVAELLGLHWTLDGRADDTPPGTELQFELWQDGGGAWSVRVVAAMQTLQQMHEMQNLTLDAPPARQILALEGCGTKGRLCSWKDFQNIAESAIDMNAVFPEPIPSLEPEDTAHTRRPRSR